MKVVIDIPEKELYKIEHDRVITDEQRSMLFCAITDGIILPKGYGDLIDRNALKEEMQKADIKANDYETLAKMYENCVDNAPTITPERH